MTLLETSLSLIAAAVLGATALSSLETLPEQTQVLVDKRNAVANATNDFTAEILKLQAHEPSNLNAAGEAIQAADRELKKELE